MAKLTSYQIEQHLAKTLASVYLVNGDEHLLVQETVALIRQAAHKAGFIERISLPIEPGADWGKILFNEAHSFSLFATHRIIEINLANTKPNAETSKIVQDIVKQPLPNTILLFSAHKLDSKTEKSAWYKAIEKQGVVVSIWPITLEQLPNWILQRAKKIGVTISPQSAQQLALQVEGNLLAADQEIQKLSLLQLTESLDPQTIATVATDNARYDIFNLVDCALAGQSHRCIRILEALKAENTETVLILWALTRELRTLASLAKQIKQGNSLSAALSQFRIWEKRQPYVRRFLQHHNQQNCWSLILQSAQIDRMIKGLASGNIWEALQNLTLNMAGNGIMQENPL